VISQWISIVTPPHILVGALLAGVSFLAWGSAATLASIAGSLIMLVNLWVLGWVWAQLLLKKMFALPLAIIVIKYPLLMMVLWKLIVGQHVHAAGLSVGLSSVLGTVLVLAVRHHRGTGPKLLTILETPNNHSEPATPHGTEQQSADVDTSWVDHSERL